LALLGDIVGVERIGIGLIGVRGAMPEDDHKAARAQGVDDFGIAGALRVGRTDCQKERGDEQEREAVACHDESLPHNALRKRLCITPALQD
jgi:hypothetical protein